MDLSPLAYNSFAFVTQQNGDYSKIISLRILHKKQTHWNEMR